MIASYQSLKALHVLAVVLLVAAMLVTAVALPGADATTRLRLRRWHLVVATPLLLAVLMLGTVLAIAAGWFAAGWLQAKLVLVAVLVGLHAWQARWLRGSARVPLWPAFAIVLLVTGIAILAAAKP